MGKLWRKCMREGRTAKSMEYTWGNCMREWRIAKSMEYAWGNCGYNE